MSGSQSQKIKSKEGPRFRKNKTNDTKTPPDRDIFRDNQSKDQCTDLKEQTQRLRELQKRDALATHIGKIGTEIIQGLPRAVVF